MSICQRKSFKAHDLRSAAHRHLSEGEVRALFDAARDTDYGKIAKDVRAIAARIDRDDRAETSAEARSQFARLKARHAQIVAIDFFGGEGRQVG
jgi:hypothetical protein